MHKRFDGWLMVVIGLAVLAALPLAANPGLPNGSDVLYHTYRVGEMARSWEHGMPFPRWAEGLYYGYGSPLWHFYASLTYYITTVFVRYLNMSALDALRCLLVLMFMGMGSGMYMFVRHQASRAAGLLASAAYLYAPYILFTEPYARGTYPEMLAFTLFPWVMWRFGGLLRVPSGVNVALASVSLYLLAVSHNLMAITLTALLIGWLIWHLGARLLAAPSQWRATARPFVFAAACVLLGLGLSGYFWVPAILEADTVNLQNLTGVALLDYHNFFVSLGALLRPMPLNDLGAINGLRNVTVLGVPQWVGALSGLAAVALFIWRALRQGQRDDGLLRQGIFFALAALVFIFFITPASSFIWDAVRGIQFLQFPWRLLGPAAFCLAFLVGMNALWLEALPSRLGGALAGGMVVVLLLAGAPGLTVPEWRNRTVDTSIAAYHQSEVAGLQRGTTFTDEYRPRTVYTLPAEVPSLLADYADGAPVNKANVPDGVTATPTFYSPVWLEWQVVAPVDFQMEVYTFFWDGWRAVVNEQSVPITPSAEHGLITLPVPAGTHIVRVYLATTPARLAGNLLSMLSLAILLAIVAIRIHNQARFPWASVALQRQPSLAAAAGVIAVGVAFVLANPRDVLYRATPLGSAPASVPVDYTLSNGVRVLGYDISGTRFRPGDVVNVVVYWFPLEQAAVNYSSFVHIGAVGQPPLAQQDKLHPAGRAMREWWKPEGYLYDEYSVVLPPDMPPGEYTIIVGMYTCEMRPPGACGNGDRPTVTRADGTVLGDVLPLVTIRVE